MQLAKSAPLSCPANHPILIGTVFNDRIDGKCIRWFQTFDMGM